jgi:hypothetical protein
MIQQEVFQNQPNHFLAMMGPTSKINRSVGSLTSLESTTTTSQKDVKDYNIPQKQDIFNNNNTCYNHPAAGYNNNNNGSSNNNTPNNRIILRPRARFPMKLRQILRDASSEGNEHIISWLPNGLAFRISQPEMFSKHLMKRYFRQSHYRSFTRQLYHYGFERCEEGAFYHPLFQRDNEVLSYSMGRKKNDTATGGSDGNQKMTATNAGSPLPTNNSSLLFDQTVLTKQQQQQLLQQEFNTSSPPQQMLPATLIMFDEYNNNNNTNTNANFLSTSYYDSNNTMMMNTINNSMVQVQQQQQQQQLAPPQQYQPFPYCHAKAALSIALGSGYEHHQQQYQINQSEELTKIEPRPIEAMYAEPLNLYSIQKSWENLLSENNKDPTTCTNNNNNNNNNEEREKKCYG